MNKKCVLRQLCRLVSLTVVPMALAPSLGWAQAAIEYAATTQAATPAATEAPGSKATRSRGAAMNAGATARPSSQVMQGPSCPQGVTEAGQPVMLSIGKSQLMKLPGAVSYRTLGSPAVVHAVLVPPDRLYLLGMGAGSTNMIVQDRSGACQMIDVVVGVDTGALTSSLRTLLPDEKDIKVSASANSLVLSGTVEDATTAERAVEIANAFVRRTQNFGGNVQRVDVTLDATTARQQQQSSVINHLQVRAPQQVMLEVKIAEVSKSLLDKLGGAVALNRSIDGTAVSVLGGFATNTGGVLDLLRVGSTRLRLDGQKDDGLIRVLAEPNLMAVSGAKAEFNSGGKIFIPVTQTNIGGGAPVITLEEKRFGIGVRFTPTVLSNKRINLNLVSVVSDLSQTGSPFTTINGVTSVLPSMTDREASTTVQLGDGQSLVIAGLIKNNFTETVRRFPGLGETPILGALFRSTEFQNDRTELLFVVTPRLVKPMPDTPRLPTDNHVVPTRGEVYLGGRLESRDASVPASPSPDIY